MTHTITTSAGAITPITVSDYSAERPARNREHPIAGTQLSDWTLRPGGLRRGSMTLTFSAALHAMQALNRLSLPESFTFAPSAPVQLGMRFVVTDPGVSVTLRADLDMYTVVVPFAEVPA